MDAVTLGLAQADAKKRYVTVVGVSPSGTDDTGALQAAINKATALGGAEVRLQRSGFGALNHKINAPLVLPADVPVAISGEQGSRLVATAAMTAMITKTSGGQAVYGIALRDLYLDGAHLAQRCVDIDQATNPVVERCQFWNATNIICEFGRTGANKVLGLRMSNVIMRAVDGNQAGDSPTMMANYGLRMGTFATDAIIENTTIINVKIGVSDNVGGGTVYNKVHVFGYPYPTSGSTTSYVGTKGFEVLGGMCRFTDCYADTQLIGFDLQGVGGNLITNSLFYWPVDFASATPLVGINFASPNNVVVSQTMRLPSTSSLTGYPFQVQANATACNVIGSNIYGSTWMSMWNLVGGATMPQSVANVWGSGTFPQSIDMGTGTIQGGGLGVYSAAGTGRNLTWYTTAGAALNRRWLLGADTSAEVGSAQGSHFILNSYLDNGNFGFALTQWLRHNGVRVDKRATADAPVKQTLAAAGAVAIDASAGSYQVVLLQANCTSTTIANTSSNASTVPVDGQRLTLTYSQDATGGRTYVWPTSCRFNNNTAPSDTTANRRTTVTFVYEAAAALWFQTTPAVVVPVG